MGPCAADSFDHLKFCQGLFVHGEAEARKIFVKIHETVLRFRFALEDIPEKFVADFDVHDGEIFGHRGIQAGHDHVIIVHLAGVRNHGYGMGFSERGDLARLGDAADAIGIELDVIHRAGFEQGRGNRKA